MTDGITGHEGGARGWHPVHRRTDRAAQVVGRLRADQLMDPTNGDGGGR